MLKKDKHTASGFTLIELLVVIAIIGVLAAVALLALNQSRMKARDARRVSDMKQFKLGLDIFFETGRGYPDKATFDGSWASGTILSCGSVPTMRVAQDPLYPTFQYDYQPALGATTLLGCGSLSLISNYQIIFYLESTGAGTPYLMNADGQFTPPLPPL